MSETYKMIFPAEFYNNNLKNDIRLDNRKFSECREMVINKGSISTGDSSAFVTLGGTKVLSVIKKDIIANIPGENLEDFLVIHVDIPSLCGFQNPNFTAQDYSRHIINFLYETLKCSHCIKLESFIIEKMTFTALQIDVLCLSYDGNVQDAAMMAIISSLLELKSDKELVDFNKIPVSTTFSIFENKILLDPTGAEESYSSTSINITCSSDGQILTVRNSDGFLSNKNLKNCTLLAQSSTKKYFKTLQVLNNQL